MTMGRPTPWARAAASIVASVWALIACTAGSAHAQTLAYRGFAELTGQLFPQDTPSDDAQAIAAFHLRLEPSVRLAPWARVRAGLDARFDTRRYVERVWRVDWQDRSPARPVVSVRQAQVTLSHGPLTVDAGKQFIRWGKTDILAPTDRFAPRDVLEVVEDDFLAIGAVRTQVASNTMTLDLIYAPRMTPSRLPLIDSRWISLPPEALGADLVIAGPAFPGGPQFGARLNYVGAGFEGAVAAYSGYNHLAVPSLVVFPPSPSALVPGPRVLVTSVFPAIHMVGGDLVVPVRWMNVKGEAAYVRSRDGRTDDYVLYVIQVERQSGELSMVLGYAGQYIARDRPGQEFGADRGLTRAVVGRLGYTIDATRSVALEAAVRQNLDGVWIRPEYSQALGAHWRLTLGGHVIRGQADDFIGQFRRNSHLAATARWSF
jgi:hypothetical protein